MSYRRRYWKEAITQIKASMEMIWYGVILNRGHTSRWKRPKD